MKFRPATLVLLLIAMALGGYLLSSPKTYTSTNEDSVGHSLAAPKREQPKHNSEFPL